MNNSEFRKLLASKSASAPESGATPSSKPGALGVKKSAFAGMTPRPGKTTSTDEFARQVREQHASLRPTKKFKSYVPKGSKFTAGYVDRARARQDADDDEDDKEKRIKALEEQVKLSQLSQDTFEALRDEITGGDASTTHLVKGLDRRLLERVRRGEDVLGLQKSSEEGDEPVDVEDALDQVAEGEIEAVRKERAEKKGNKAPEQLAGKKRTRDEIMAELKAQRKAAVEAKASTGPILDKRWRRVGDKATPRVEIDHKGREVVTLVGNDGTVKKMIRKLKSAKEGQDAALVPDARKPVLGADFAVPEHKRIEADDDDDIFADAGTEYDPLGDLGEDDGSQSDDDAASPEPSSSGPVKPSREKPSDGAGHTEYNGVKHQNMAPEVPSKPQPIPSRNYFGNKQGTADDGEKDRFKGIENVLKKAAKIGDGAADDDEDENDEIEAGKEARLAKHAKMLAQEDRDLDDIDMGFGGSRLEDEADMDDTKIKFSQWKGGADGDDEPNGKKGDGKKQRKPKKRKGDANKMSDIMRVIEGRKGGSGSK